MLGYVAENVINVASWIKRRELYADLIQLLGRALLAGAVTARRFVQFAPAPVNGYQQREAAKDDKHGTYARPVVTGEPVEPIKDTLHVRTIALGVGRNV